MQELFSWDMALFGGFMALSVGMIIFRRFHHYESLIRPEELGPTAWGLYGARQDIHENRAPVAVSRKTTPRR